MENIHKRITSGPLNYLSRVLREIENLNDEKKKIKNLRNSLKRFLIGFLIPENYDIINDKINSLQNEIAEYFSYIDLPEELYLEWKQLQYYLTKTYDKGNDLITLIKLSYWDYIRDNIRVHKINDVNAVVFSSTTAFTSITPHYVHKIEMRDINVIRCRKEYSHFETVPKYCENYEYSHSDKSYKLSLHEIILTDGETSFCIYSYSEEYIDLLEIGFKDYINAYKEYYLKNIN